MEIGARLHHLHLHSPKPEALARFYARAYDMRAEARNEWPVMPASVRC